MATTSGLAAVVHSAVRVASVAVAAREPAHARLQGTRELAAICARACTLTRSEVARGLHVMAAQRTVVAS